MAKRGGGSGRKYARDSIGRFASKGFSGQTGGRGARLKAKGKKRDGGGAIVKPSRIGEMKNTISKSSSKRKVNASSRASDRQIARDVAARAKKESVTANSARATGKLTRPVAKGNIRRTGGKKGKAKPAAAKPATTKRRGAVGKISEAKAGRIVARMDAQRGRKALPGRRNANFVRTYERSRQFILKPSTAALKKGKPISVNESVQKAVANAAKRRNAKPAAAKRKSKKVSADKVSRIADRVNKVSTTTGGRQGVKALNRTQVAVRAKGFLSRKAGGVSGLNSSGASRADKIKSVQSSINTRTKYSTQKPNRNKPGRFNDLGQSSLRAKNKIAAQTPRQKIAAAKPVKAKPSNRMLGRRELLSRNPVSAPNTVRASGLKSTVKRSKAPKKSSLVVRTRQQSKAAQKFRRESVLTRTRKPGSIGLGGTTPNARVKRQRTGTQLSLLGKAAPLYKFRPVKRRRS